MVKSEKKDPDACDVPQSQTWNSPSPPSSSKLRDGKTGAQRSGSTLVICRNKHWRYISSFHGPWLQLPPEVLESLANNNYNLPRPRPIDPATFFDLLKIRKLVDDATNLAVRATNGVTSSSLTNSLNAGNGLLGNGGTALGLGLGGGGGGGNAKLSRERKHRMREQATQKLSKAYHLDEIACSVATMQSASALEDVAHLVLQRSPPDADAKYVHFFHEKIPSRQLAECTSLKPLDEVIAERPGEAEILRTRAITKIFKDDFFGAAQDLSSALQLHRYYQGQHRASIQQFQLISEAAAEAPRSGRRKEEIKLDEGDHPSSLEPQLLFHRAGVYLTIACQNVSAALPAKRHETIGFDSDLVNGTGAPLNGESGMIEREKEVLRISLEARKIVKTNAKRALRDYISFLSFFDYTPGLSAEVSQAFSHKVNQAANEMRPSKSQGYTNGLDLGSNTSLSNGQLSDALVSHYGASASRSRHDPSQTADVPALPLPVVYQISALFSATPPVDLTPYPKISTALVTKQHPQTPQNAAAKALLAEADAHEALTYHPLLTDALHSLLLCHCLVQTSARELQRHAHMVARLARVCDGYPIFQAARSPSRADWIEVLRRGGNWIQLQQSWESLCAPAPLPGQQPQNEQKETAAQNTERLKQQAVMEALEDDRVHDEASFHAAVAARQRRQVEEARKAEGVEMPRRWAQEDGKDYPISTERAHAVVRWTKEAPIGREAGGATRKKKRSPKAGLKGNAQLSHEDMMNSLKVNDGDDTGERASPVQDEVY